MGPRLHPRAKIMSVTSADLSHRPADWYEANPDLTPAETISIIGGALGNEVAGLAKVLIRDERASGEST